MRYLASAVLAASLMFAGCGESTTTVRGKVTDGTGTQKQALEAPSAPAPSFGGAGTVSASGKVTAWTMNENGTLNTLATADVGADGSYSIELPAGVERVVIATDGEKRASVLVDRAGEAGGERLAAPMSAESSLEAEVFMRMVAQGSDAGQVDTVSLRALVDEAMAAQVQAQHGAGKDVSAALRALADAALVAQEARVKAYARAGLNVTAAALFEAQVDASTRLDAALHAGEAAAAAYEQFYSDLEAARERLGAKAKERADGERSASAGFRGAVQARLGADVDSAALLTAAIRAAAAHEGRAAEAAANAAIATAAQVDEAKARVASAFTAFRASLKESASATATANAYAQLSASLATGADIEATALGAQLGVSTVTQMTASASAEAAVQASATLQASLEATFTALASANDVEVAVVAEEIAEAYGVYSDAVAAQATALAGFGPRAQGGVELLLIAEGSFRSGN